MFGSRNPSTDFVPAGRYGGSECVPPNASASNSFAGMPNRRSARAAICVIRHPGGIVNRIEGGAAGPLASAARAPFRPRFVVRWYVPA